jgi:sortase A
MKEKNNKKGDFLESDVRKPLIASENDSETATEADIGSSPKTRKNKHLKELLLLLVAVICIAAGVFFLLRRPVTEKIRTLEEVTIIEKIEAGEETIIVKSDAFVVEGEGYEIFDDTIDFQNPDETEATLPENVVLTAAGTIQMDAIDLNLPLWDDAGVVPLRYGAGILVDSVLPGQEGNLVILGHRMKTYGSLFNRLGEIKIGDEVIIDSTDGNKYVYIVDQIESAIKPSALPDYIEQSNNDGVRLTLVTCTPTGVGTHRLIIIAHLAV